MNNTIYYNGSRYFQCLIMIKLIIFLIILFSLQATAEGLAQRLTLHGKGKKLEKVMMDIWEQTGYHFILNGADLEKALPVTLDIKNVELQAALKTVFADQPFRYTLAENMIVILPLATDIIRSDPSEKTIESNLVLSYTEVRGRVVDSLGQPLPGASIRVLTATGQRTSLHAMTDQDGWFVLKDVPVNSQLEISYLGYLTKTLKGISNIGNIVMQVDESAIEAVSINAGYYSVTDRQRTGSISRVTAEVIQNQPVSNTLGALIGRMPGVNIVQSTGMPGSGFSVEIRGRNSITGNTQPLYIVDGVPFSNEGMGDFETGFVLGTSAASGNSQSGLSPMIGINPSDIESIEVLKDADATAIYGSRGANGVVLITTRRFRKNAKSYSLRYTQGFGEMASRYNLLNTEEYLQIRREAYENDGVAIPSTAHDVNGNWDPKRYTDWQEVLVGNTAIQNNLQVSVQGGSDLTSFVLSGSSYRETTVFPGDYANRKFTTRSVVNHRSADNRFQASANVALSVDKNNFPGVDLNSAAIRLAPNAPALYNEDGSLNWANNTWDNPLANLEQNYRSKYDYLNASATLSQELLDNLVLSARGGINYGWMDESRARPHTMVNPAYGFGSESSSIRMSSTARQSWIVEPQLNYSRNWTNGLRINGLVGATFQSRTESFLSQNAAGFTSNSLIYDIKSASQFILLDNRSTEYRYSAIYGRVNFDLHNRYFLNFTGRRDGSSRFGPGKQFASFGAVGAAWIFSDEAFARPLAGWLSYGKLRGSYGLTGSDNIGDYKFLDTYSSSTIKYDGKIGLTPTNLYNPDFAWETNAKLEGSLELGFFGNRLELIGSYYRNRSSNQLVGVPLPTITGFPSIHSNLNATVQNTGLELELSSVNINAARIRWTTMLSLTLPKNKLVSFPNLALSTYASQYVVGHPLNILRRYNFQGVNTETGVFQYEDVNEDGRYTIDDRTLISHLSPRYYGGLNNSLTIGDLQLDVFFQFVKQDGRNFWYTYGLLGLAGNFPREVLDRWQSPGDVTDIQRPTSGVNSAAVTAYSNLWYSTALVSDASFIRLKNVNLSYNVPSKWLGGVDGNLYLQGQNLMTITAYKGADPESNASANASIAPLRMWTFGIQLNF